MPQFISGEAMGNPDEYRRKALECAALAVACRLPELKVSWLQLELHWLRLAEQAELQSQMDPFAAFILAKGTPP